MFLLKLCDTLNKHKVDFAICGGWAVALHGVVRGTVDVDIAVAMTKQNLALAEKALMDLGLRSSLPLTANEVFNFRKEYIEKRNLIAWSFVNPKNPIEVVDIIITYAKKNLAVKVVTLNGKKVPVLAMEQLIAMKKKSGRPQDLEDARALEAKDEKI